MGMARYGITAFDGGSSILDQEKWIRELPDLGYTDFWTGESNGYDGFTPLLLAAQWAPSLRLATGIVPAYTRAPALMAQCAASLAIAAPGRAVLGVGTSSNIIV